MFAIGSENFWKFEFVLFSIIKVLYFVEVELAIILLIVTSNRVGLTGYYNGMHFCPTLPMILYHFMIKQFKNLWYKGR